MTQQEYVEILANDLGMNRVQRNDFISIRLGRDIKYLDELSTVECSLIIGQMKSKKDANKNNLKLQLEDKECNM